VKPKNGHFYYFEKYRRLARKVKERLRKFRETNVCPFCGAPINHRGSLVVYIMARHFHEMRSVVFE